jgi:hypothetical protein
MTATARVTYSVEGFPNTVMMFGLTGTDSEDIIKNKMPLKKKELDKKFNVEQQKSSITMDSIIQSS